MRADRCVARGLAVAAVALAGCSFHEKPAAQEQVARVSGMVQLDPDGELRNAGFEGTGGSESIRGTIGLGLRRVDDDRALADPSPRIGGSFDLGLQLSLFGLLSSDRRFDHWLDLGVSGAAGVGAASGRDDTLGLVRGGGWVELGLGQARGRRPVLVLGLERVLFNGTTEHQTLFTIGFGMRTRDPGALGGLAGAFAH